MAEKTGRGKENVEYIPLSAMEEIVPPIRLNLEGIVEEHTYQPRDGRAYLYAVCSVEGRYKGKCPHCRSRNFYGNGRYPKNRLIHDVNIGMTGVDIDLIVPRYRCNDCDKSFAYYPKCILPKQQFTKRLLEQIRWEVFHWDFKTVGKLHRCSESAIGKVFEGFCDELDQERKERGVRAPRVLGIDEKHICHKMRGMLVNIETSEILEMTEDNKPATIQAAIESLVGYENIEIVTMDMANGYMKLIQTILPDATVVIDKFHVIQDMSIKTRKVRKRVFTELKKQHSADPEKMRLLNAASMDNYLFRYSDQEMRNHPEKAKMMAELCSTFPEIRTLRKLKKGFEELYLCQTYEDASASFDAWNAEVGQADKTLFDEFFTLRRSMSYWRDGVLNYFRPGCQYTNATTEGMNSYTQGVNELGNGYGFKALRGKVLYGREMEYRIDYMFKRVKVGEEPREEDLVSFAMFYRFNNTASEFWQVTRLITDRPMLIRTPPLICDPSTIPVLSEVRERDELIDMENETMDLDALTEEEQYKEHMSEKLFGSKSRKK